MTRHLRRLLLVSAAGASLLAGCAEGVGADDTTGTSAVARSGRSSADGVVRGYLKGKGKAKAAEQLQVVSQSSNGGRTHLRLEQVVDGFRVQGVYVKATVDAQGQLAHIIDQLAGPANHPTPSSLSARDALAVALAELGYDAGSAGAISGGAGNVTSFGRGATFHRDPTVERVAYVDETAGALREGFLVETWAVRGNQLDHTLIDNRGAVLSVERRTNNDRYNVYLEDPSKGPQTVVSGKAGWLGTGGQTTINISGNNAHSYLDTDANNAADTGGTAVTNGDFLTAADLGVSPGTTGNRAVAVQNLHYLVNTTHDILYGHGFDEAAGNFQVDNFGNGGLGNDPVNAEAQDGSGTDNANFSTPSDGSSPRMQMYLWTGQGPNAFVNMGGNDYDAYNSSFGPQLTATPVVAGTALATPIDACAAVTGVSGKVAIVDRGGCNFTVKVLNAQKAGAIAVIIANNVAGRAFSPGGTERRVKIPSVMVTQDNGTALKALVPATAALRKNPVVPLQIDGDLDAGIVYHEYGHGLTWRMIGSMSGAISGALGEGSSDTVAFLITGNPIMGAYAYSDPAGIRRYPYNAYGLTYKAVDGAEVHNDGEIFAAAMWATYEEYKKASLTNDDLLDDFVHSMSYIPSGPNYEAMRDGLLQQVAGSGRECLVWRGFARLGIGQGSSLTISRRGVVTVVESFTVPAACGI